MSLHDRLMAPSGGREGAGVELYHMVGRKVWEWRVEREAARVVYDWRSGELRIALGGNHSA